MKKLYKAVGRGVVRGLVSLVLLFGVYGCKKKAVEETEKPAEQTPVSQKIRGQRHREQERIIMSQKIPVAEHGQYYREDLRDYGALVLSLSLPPLLSKKSQMPGALQEALQKPLPYNPKKVEYDVHITPDGEYINPFTNHINLFTGEVEIIK